MELRSGIALGRLGVGEYIRGGTDPDASGRDRGRAHTDTALGDESAADVESIHCDASEDVDCECKSEPDAYKFGSSEKEGFAISIL